MIRLEIWDAIVEHEIATEGELELVGGFKKWNIRTITQKRIAVLYGV